jgi:outer membrane lipase/esterase
VRLDVYQKLNDVVADPGAFDLTEVQAVCVTPNVPPFRCKNADEYLFWDGIHPSKATHAIVAQEAARVLPH